MMYMDAYDAMQKRRSIRSFIQKEVEFEKIINILEAANEAPSAGNLQDWRFIVVYRKDAKEQLAACCPKQEWLAQAPVVIVVCAEVEQDEQMWGSSGMIYALQNTAAATQNLLTAAVAEGLGTCWVGSFVQEQVQELLEVPQGAQPMALVALGYYEEEPMIDTAVHPTKDSYILNELEIML